MYVVLLYIHKNKMTLHGMTCLHSISLQENAYTEYVLAFQL